MLSKRNIWLLKIVLFLFALNSLTRCLYFTSHSKPPSSSPSTVNRHFNGRNHRYLKPWPILPSYLPWSRHSPPPLSSCEAYFGNGFSDRRDLFGNQSGGGGWFRCWYSDTLRSSVCEGGRIRMDPGRVLMSRGAERLEEVIGRKEEEELPRFENGAFEVDGGPGFRGSPRRLVADELLDRYVPRGGIGTHTMRDLFGSARIVGPDHFECQRFLARPQHEGVGAIVRRSTGRFELKYFDPFLILDEFSVTSPAGFPDHPHRGFETVTYMLQGSVTHEDFEGHKGTIEAGDLQWMTAGRGIVHSEMPAAQGTQKGLQLWINLSSKHKM
ncbi:beta-(1,2)-xylosyltransferase [Fagus crenata]